MGAVGPLRFPSCSTLFCSPPQCPSPKRPLHPIRKTILEILKRQSHATVSELAERLEMAPVSVRHHLDLLISDGLVFAPRVRRRPGAGRPKQVYALTLEADAYFPNKYRQLAEDGLQALKQALSPEQVQMIMRDLAARTAEQLPANVAALPVTERMEAVALFLSEQGYMAGHEIDGDDVILHTCNCPYSALAAMHGELCHMDLALMTQLTGLEPVRVAHIAEGDARCSYRFCRTEVEQLQAASLVLTVSAEDPANV